MTGTAGELRIVELRQYTLRPGRRDELIGLFEREFVESQEEAGIRLLGLFRDLERPDRFVWLRGFPDMEARAESLAAFYERHEAWKRHGPAANATMIDSDDVLLLRPVTGDLAREGARPSGDGEGDGDGVIGLTVNGFRDAEELDTHVRAFTPRTGAPRTGTPPLATLRTEPAANSYPRLPVREGEHVFVRLARYPDEAACRAHGPTLVLAPTARSALR
ncbi:NIPSNAP family protein [Streptomyces albiaxialis]|uniref:NIPSNAP family protein n=1 Tax=Streptomyces albiaxialis TaxID=329523 RepID=A0ABN2VG49_9ACTN